MGSNIFRPEYRALNEDEKKLIDDIKDKAMELYNLFPTVDGKFIKRETSLAATKLEESIMWVVKGITS